MEKINESVLEQARKNVFSFIYKKYKNDHFRCGVEHANILTDEIVQEAESYLRGETPEKEGTVWVKNVYYTKENIYTQFLIGVSKGEVYYAVGKQMITNIDQHSLSYSMLGVGDRFPDMNFTECFLEGVMGFVTSTLAFFEFFLPRWNTAGFMSLILMFLLSMTPALLFMFLILANLAEHTGKSQKNKVYFNFLIDNKKIIKYLPD